MSCMTFVVCETRTTATGLFDAVELCNKHSSSVFCIVLRRRKCSQIKCIINQYNDSCDLLFNSYIGLLYITILC